MKFIDTALPGCTIIEPAVLSDTRGVFFENWNAAKFAAAGIHAQFVQSNVSISTQGVLRGLHYQWPNPQAKLVQVLEGEVWDVAVDLRRGSPTYLRSAAVVLSADNRRQFWIAEGFAHGFVVVSERAVFSYLCTALYDRECDASLRWNDGQLAIDWPVSEPSLSEKDAKAPFLADIPLERLPVYAG